MDSSNKTIQGVITRHGQHIHCSAVVLCTGTFLHGVCHIGKWNVPAGRFHVSTFLPFHVARHAERGPAVDPPRRLLALPPSPHRAFHHRHAPAVTPRFHRLVAAGHAGVRRSRGSAELSEHLRGGLHSQPIPLSSLRDDIHKRRNPRDLQRPPRGTALLHGEPRERPGPAVLPVHREEGSPFPRKETPSDLAGAGGPRNARRVPERPRDRLRRRNAAETPPDHAGTGARGHAAAGVRGGVRLRRSRGSGAVVSAAIIGQFVSRGADQWNHRIRRGRCAGEITAGVACRELWRESTRRGR